MLILMMSLSIIYNTTDTLDVTLTVSIIERWFDWFFLKKTSENSEKARNNKHKIIKTSIKVVDFVITMTFQ